MINSIQLNLPANLNKFVQTQVTQSGFQNETEYLISLIQNEQELASLPWSKELDERLDQIESKEAIFSDWSKLGQKLDPRAS